MKTVSRPATLSVSNLDLAVEQALQRLAQVRELAAEECSAVGGGLISGGLGGTTGMVPPVPKTTFEL